MSATHAARFFAGINFMPDGVADAAQARSGFIYRPPFVNLSVDFRRAFSNDYIFVNANRFFPASKSFAPLTRT